MLEMNLIKLKKSDLWNMKLISKVHLIIFKIDSEFSFRGKVNPSSFWKPYFVTDELFLPSQTKDAYAWILNDWFAWPQLNKHCQVFLIGA